MCEAKESTKTKLDRLINSMDDLASAIHSLKGTLNAPQSTTPSQIGGAELTTETPVDSLAGA